MRNAKRCRRTAILRVVSIRKMNDWSKKNSTEAGYVVVIIHQSLLRFSHECDCCL